MREVTIPQKAMIFVVPVFNGPHVDEAEHRRRTRYAVLSGLNASESIAEGKYVPDDAEHIGYFELPTPPQHPRHGLPEVVPYEWFHRTKDESRRLLLLWLDEDMLSAKPIYKIGDVVSRLHIPCGSPRADSIGLVVLGPVNSNTLKQMYEEMIGLGKQAMRASSKVVGPYACVRRATIYSYSATASAAQLGGNLKMYDADLASPFRSVRGITILRSIQTDQQVLAKMISELDRRAVETRDVRSHIALISEWDTLYGQKFRDSLSYALCGNNQASSVCDRRIHQYSYMRGLDGVVPKAATPSEAKTSPPSPEASKGLFGTRVERAEGDSQTDYLRRLADHLQETARHLGRGETFRAIGVVGTDVYDKLLVLQALRPNFPSAVFFTTDLDARFIHTDQFAWARNLVVASTFGLRFHPTFQRDVPPFRDSYQSSAFFAARLAITRSNETNVWIGQERIDEWLDTRLFEIGRNVAFDLTPEGTQGKSGPALTCVDFPDCQTIYPRRDEFIPRFHDASALLILAAAALGFVLIYGISRPVQQCVSSTIDCIWKRGISCGSAVGIGVGLSILAVIAWKIAEEGDEGEPLTVATGISIWPTEIIRALTAVLAVIFIVKVWTDVRNTTCRLSSEFFPNRGGVIDRRLPIRILFTRNAWSLIRRVYDIGRITSPTAKTVNAEELWQDYKFRSCGLSRALRIVPFGIVFYLFGITIVNIFGLPSVPTRGIVSARIDRALLFAVCGPLVIFLLFLVVDVTRLCGRFIREVSLQIPTAWPPAGATRFRAASNVDADDLSHWLDICFIAEWTETVGRLFFYPFIVVVLMMVARSAIFDNWTTPIGLIVAFGLTFIYAVGCGLYLRKTAETARRVVVEQLTGSLIKAKGEGESRRATAEQLSLLIDGVKAMRRGSFAPLSQQTLIRAALLPLSGASGIAVIEYLLFGH